jgi:hypothetical protein
MLQGCLTMCWQGMAAKTTDASSELVDSKHRGYQGVHAIVRNWTGAHHGWRLSVTEIGEGDVDSSGLYVERGGNQLGHPV